MSSDWESINVFLPPAKYPTGPGVVDALRMKVGGPGRGRRKGGWVRWGLGLWGWGGEEGGWE